MATIYRFIVEQGTSQKSGGRTSGTSSRKKTGKTTTLLKSLSSGNKGGVEHNRKLRAINPLINRATGGYWEKGMRVGRAGLGLVKFNSETGKFAGLSEPAIAIIIALCVQTVMKHHAKLIEKTDKYNKLDYKSLEVGQNLIHGMYETNVNMWSGRVSYKDNK